MKRLLAGIVRVVCFVFHSTHDRRATAIGIVLAATFFALLPIRADAAKILWNGGGTDGSWGDSKNWTGGAVTFNDTLEVEFAQDKLTNTYIVADRTINYLFYNNTPSPFTIRLTDTQTGTTAKNLIFAGTAPTIRITASAVGRPILGVAGGTVILSNELSIIDDSTAGFIINRPITGSFGLNKTGVGLLELAAANTYSGVTTVNTNGGSFKISNNDALGTTASGTVVYTGASVDLNGCTVASEPFAIGGNGSAGNGSLVNKSANAASLGGAVALIADATIGCTNPLSSFTISGSITGAFALTKNGGGLLVLAGANTYSGVTRISAGSLRLDNNNALGTTANGTVVSNGCSIDVNGCTVASEAFTIIGIGSAGNGSLVNRSANAASLSGPVALAAAATIGCTNPLSSFTISGSITGAFALTKNGVLPGFPCVKVRGLNEEGDCTSS